MHTVSPQSQSLLIQVITISIFGGGLEDDAWARLIEPSAKRVINVFMVYSLVSCTSCAKTGGFSSANHPHTMATVTNANLVLLMVYFLNLKKRLLH